MNLLTKFGYDEQYFNELLIKSILSDAVLFSDSTMLNHLLQITMNGGKRIRPLLVLLSGDSKDDLNKRQLYTAAVAIELMHIASLIHDDIIDQSTTRHNIKTLHNQYSLETSIHLGDYLLNKSMELFSQFKIPRLHEEISIVMKKLCLGELNQQHNYFNFNLSFDDYIDKSEQKTGALISLSLVVGGLVHGLEPQLIDRLSMIGSHIGIAYQVKDDILDFTSTAHKVGKPVGYDLRNGIVTLPTLFALEDSIFKNDILELNPDTEPSQFDLICEQIKNSTSIKKANDICKNYITMSKKLIDELPTQKNQFLNLINLIFN